MTISGDPAVLNPAITASAVDVPLGSLMYESLVRFGPGFTVEPNLAKSWTISADGLTYTFDLVDANWQDGEYYGTGRYPDMGMAIASLTSSSAYNGSALWHENNILEYDQGRSPYDDFDNPFDMEAELLTSATERAKSGIDANCYLYQSRALQRSTWAMRGEMQTTGAQRSRMD